MEILNIILFGYMINLCLFAFRLVFATLYSILYIMLKQTNVIDMKKTVNRYKYVLEKCPFQERHIGILSLLLPFSQIITTIKFQMDLFAVKYDLMDYFNYTRWQLCEKYDIEFIRD